MTDLIVPHTFSDGPGNVASGVQVSENFQAVKDKIDGNINGDNLDVATITDFLKNGVGLAGDRKIGAGSANIGAAGWGLTNIKNIAVPHGLPSAPLFAVGWCSVGSSTGDAEDPVGVSPRATPWDATSLHIRAWTRSGGNFNFPTLTFYWVALY